MEKLTGRDLYKIFEYGTMFVSEQRKHLNDINVFPVPDGDTGNNLVHTLKTIIRESQEEDSFFEMLDSISASALIGARGNSGVIFSQFVNGLSKASPQKEEIEITEFAQMIEEGYNYTYNSLSNPVEGTIITVMREFALVMKDALHIGLGSLEELFGYVSSKMKDALQRTTQLLSVLEANNVVDSGALGFVLFLRGADSYFKKEELNLQIAENVHIEDVHHFEGDVTFRYCTEVLFESVDDQVDIKNDLTSFGDSIIVADGKYFKRVHIHTNHPELVVEYINQIGRIETHKADDMKLEMNLKNSSKSRVLVTDSIADIDYNLLEENNVVVIPVNVDLDNVTYLDKLTINNEIIFNKLKTCKEYPKTATPTVKYINDLFSKLLLQFDEVIVVAVSKGLSSTYSVIEREVNKLVENGNAIYVVDSKNNSVSEGLIVLKAIEMMNANLDTNKIVEELNRLTNNTEILVCLETFEYAMKSGRVPKIVGKVGMSFGLRPIMTLKNGKGSAFSMAMSQKSIMKKIVKYVKKDLKTHGVEEYAIVHCENPELAKEFEEVFRKEIGKPPRYITEISSAIAIFSGLGSVAIGYIKHDL